MVYALVEPSPEKVAAAGAAQAANESEESKAGAPPTTKARPGILQMPAALASANPGAGSGLSAELSTDGAAGSQSAAPVRNAVAPCDFSPLQDLNAAVAEYDPFAWAKSGEEAESSNKTAQVS